MKKTILFSILALCVPFSGAIPAPEDVCFARTDGERKAIARGLYGEIQLVTSLAFADYCVYITNHSAAADLRVQVVKNFADSPGKWKIVDANADFRVYITKNPVEADVYIQFTTSFPGPR